jgi:hypothetical protein
MNDECAHLDQIAPDSPPSGAGCKECLETGGTWMHLRRCAVCGHIGCCDSSPNQHASKHARETGHAIIQSFEPGEDWLYCYVDEVLFEIEGMTDSPSHPPGEVTYGVGAGATSLSRDTTSALPASSTADSTSETVNEPSAVRSAAIT